MPRKTIEQMVNERYTHAEIRQAVLAEIAQADSEDSILSGVLTLPSEQDAIRHFSGLAEQENELMKANNPSGLPHSYDRAAHLKAQLEYERLRKESM